MKGFFAKHSRELILSGVIIMCLCLLIVAVVLIDGYSGVLAEQSETRVALYTNEATAALSAHLQSMQEHLDTTSVYLEGADTVGDINTVLAKARLDHPISEGLFFRYFANGTELDQASSPYTQAEDPAILAALASGKRGCLGTVYDAEINQKRIAFTAPVKNNPLVQMVVLFVPLHEVGGFYSLTDETGLALSEFAAFCSVQDNGFILEPLHAKPDYNIVTNGNALAELRKITNNKEIEDSIVRTIKEGRSDLLQTTVNGEPATIAVGSGGDDSGLCIIALFQNAEVYASGYRFMSIILVSIVILFVILIAFAVYLGVSRRRMNRQIHDFGTTDSRLGCPTGIKFEREVPELLERHKVTRFAIIATSVKHFNYITETYGEQAEEEVLRFLAMIFGKSLQTGETFAYLSDGAFALCLHYKETGMLINRLHGIHSLVYENSNSNGRNITLEFGIYEVDRDGDTNPHKMLEKAILARDNETEDLRNHFRLYKEDYFDSYMQNADIEVTMEDALANDEFKVFYQPKFNIAKNRIDGCEALVRWYDTKKKTYRSPGTFLPLFEANGFIAKLDRYVYYKVCEFIGTRAADLRRVCPVSVNISRVTALQPDFLDYYLSIKRKFKIADNFITLEFTESVAYENYEMLNSIVTILHRNGFLCSIDDFGTGYSSYNILKVMNMDEIKLDRFFISRGTSESRDRLILQSVIRVAKELGMKVTQEGVESKDALEYLRALGCDVIQGYYYSKPLSDADFVRFLESDGSAGHDT